MLVWNKSPEKEEKILYTHGFKFQSQGPLEFEESDEVVFRGYLSIGNENIVSFDSCNPIPVLKILSVDDVTISITHSKVKVFIKIQIILPSD